MAEISIAQLHKLFITCSGICIDTRKVQYGEMFFCLKGENFNANVFAQKALDNGALYAIIDEEEYYIDKRTIVVSNVLESMQMLAAFHRRQFNIPFIGITGTNGKTTTKELVNAVLSKYFKTHATKGNFNNHIGVPLTLLSIPVNTEIAIIEMGANHPGEIAELCKMVEPTYGIITSIGKAHLEGFGNIEGVIKTKTELYTSVEQSAGCIFVNADNTLLMQLSANLERYTYGRNVNADVKVKAVSDGPFASVDWMGQRINTKLVGTYNVDNIAAAIAIGNYFQVEALLIGEALREYNPENKRSQWIKTDHNDIILDAYNANPSSMKVAIDSFNKLEGKNKWLILGDMLELGTDSDMEHQAIITQLQQFTAEAILLVGPIFSRLAAKSGISVFETSKEAAEWIQANPINSALILIKGSRGIALENILDSL